MALDNTDKRLVKGLIWFTVFGSLAYVFPGYWVLPGGYRAQRQEEAQAFEKLTREAEQYRQYYRQISKPYFGVMVEDPQPEPPGSLMSQLKAQYISTLAETQKLIDQKEQSSRMSFADWTKVPVLDVRNPGVWFKQMWERKKNTLATELNGAGVTCDDPDIGFKRLSGECGSWDENKTEEYLRELFIAEKIIQLCIRAKKSQESFETSNAFQPEAFMRIMSVTPDESKISGPSALIPNPMYNETEKNPSSERFRRYRVKFWTRFIQEYPVQIVLECDVNSYMRFLHSVRAEGQFLVIRTLQILSPFMRDSRYDKTELNSDLPADPRDQDKKMVMPPDHILVKMSAAGMDFFDPVKNPHGLYIKASVLKPTGIGRRPGRAIPGAQPNP